MENPTACPKCGGTMMRGYTTDFAMARPIHPGVVSTWMEGSPPDASL